MIRMMIDGRDLPTTEPNQLGIIARRVAIRRQQLCMSVRSLAKSASVDKNTVVRLEKGLAVRRASMTKICRALGIAVERVVLSTGEPQDRFRVSRAVDRGWVYRVPPARLDAPITPPSDDSNRWEIGRIHGAGFCQLMNCELFNSNIAPAIAEVFSATNPHSHPGQELVFCLRGRLLVHIGDRTLALKQGDCITFEASESHCFSVAKPLAPGQPPPLFFAVQFLA